MTEGLNVCPICEGKKTVWRGGQGGDWDDCDCVKQPALDRETEAKQRFLGALDAFIGVRIEQHERHGQTVPTHIVEGWQASGVDLAVALDELLEACRG